MYYPPTSRFLPISFPIQTESRHTNYFLAQKTLYDVLPISKINDLSSKSL